MAKELTDLAVRHIADKKLKVFDLCAGSGCIGISIARACKNAEVTLFEKSEKAFEYLLENAEGVNNAKPLLFDINNKYDGKADIIISNPPYIESGEIESLQSEVKHEPFMALDGGNDGLDFYRIINDKWFDNLNENGLLFLEIGEKQGEDVKNLLTNFRNVEIIKDIYGNDRMVKGLI